MELLTIYELVLADLDILKNKNAPYGTVIHIFCVLFPTCPHLSRQKIKNQKIGYICFFTF